MRKKKKSKLRPARYERQWVLRAAIRLLNHLGSGKTIDSYSSIENGLDDDPVIKCFEVVQVLKAIGKGEVDARIALGQAPGRGGYRTNAPRAKQIEVAVEYKRARQLNLSRADACNLARLKTSTLASDATIDRYAREYRAEIKDWIERGLIKPEDEFEDLGPLP